MMMLTALPGWRAACARLWKRQYEAQHFCFEMRRYGTHFSSRPGWSSYSVNNDKKHSTKI
jgi:hypothetical protein